MHFEIRPLGNRVLVERIPPQQKSQGGIVIPDSAKDLPLEGWVRAVGPGKAGKNGTRYPMQVKEGDRVMFAKYAGVMVSSMDDNALLLTDEDILAVLEKVE